MGDQLELGPDDGGSVVQRDVRDLDEVARFIQGDDVGKVGAIGELVFPFFLVAQALDLVQQDGRLQELGWVDPLVLLHVELEGAEELVE